MDGMSRFSDTVQDFYHFLDIKYPQLYIINHPKNLGYIVGAIVVKRSEAVQMPLANVCFMDGICR